MTRPNIHDKNFEWKRRGFLPSIDPYYFMGKSSNRIKVPKRTIALVNLKKSNELLTLEVALPGFSRDELEVFVRDDILTVKAKKLSSLKRPASEYLISEFETETVERIFRLAKNIGHEDIKAKYDHGILHLTFTDVPKAAEKKHQIIRVT